jgi:hypothetical protein
MMFYVFTPLLSGYMYDYKSLSLQNWLDFATFLIVERCFERKTLSRFCSSLSLSFEVLYRKLGGM